MSLLMRKLHLLTTGKKDDVLHIYKQIEKFAAEWQGS